MSPPPRGQNADSEPGVAAAIALRFDGDAALYQAFAATCAEQFALDAVAGQVACAAGDQPGLRRLAHNLKSALHMLGHDRLSELAAQVEEHAASGDLRSARVSWRALHGALVRPKMP